MLRQVASRVSLGSSRVTRITPDTVSPTDTEGGADQWARPALPRIDEKKDKIGMFVNYANLSRMLTSSIVFQQIDVEYYTEGDHTTLRMYGVTEVRCACFVELEMNSNVTCRKGTVSSPMSMISSLTFILLNPEALRPTIWNPFKSI